MRAMDWIRREFWWAIHNLVAHPVSQLLWWASLFGLVRPLARLGEWVHDASVPRHQPEEGHG